MTEQTKHQPMRQMVQGLAAALPIALGYFPIAFAFGVSATKAGMTGVEAFLLSLLVFAGAAQFLAVALFASGAPAVVAGFTLVAMNLRHLLYGPALMRRAGVGAAKKRAWIWAFGLTDEVFGAALGELARGRPFSELFMIGLSGASYASWLAGTVAGAMAGGGALADYPVIEAGLGFLLPALFLALLLSILNRAQVPVVIVAIAATLAGTWAVSGTFGLLAGMVAGAAYGVWGRR